MSRQMQEYSIAVSQAQGVPLTPWPTGGPGGPPPDGQGFTLAAALRFKWTFLLTVCLLGGGGLAGVYLTSAPEYTAAARVEILPSRTRVLFDSTRDAYGGDAFFQQFLNTQVELIRGPDVLGRVLDQPQVQATDWYRNPLRPVVGAAPTDLERLSEALRVAIRPGTFVVEISAVATRPADAATLANSVRDVFLTIVEENLRSTSSGVERQLLEQQSLVDKSIRRAQDESERALSDLRVGSTEELVAQRGEQLRAIETRLRELQLRRSLLATRAATAEQARADANPGDAADGTGAPDGLDDDLLRYGHDDRWLTLRTRTDDLANQVELAGQRFGPRHPQMQQLTADLASARRELALRAALLDADLLQASGPAPLDRASLEDQRRQTQAEIDLLTADYEKLQRAFNADLKHVIDYELKDDDFSYARELRNKIRARLDQLSEEKQLGLVRPAGDAQVPSRPSNWKRPFIFTAFVLFGSVAAGFVTANWRAARRVDTQRCAGLADAPILGALPRPRAALDDQRVVDVVQSESIRIVRTSVMHRLETEQRKAVMITSAGPSTGKSTVAIMLARSIADAGKRVLLVDADLRRPAIARYLKLGQPPGLADVLRGEAAPENIVQYAEDARLWVAPAGRLRGLHEVDIITRERLETLVAAWRTQFDLLIVDACPILPVADARMLLPAADGVIVVAREGRCSTRDLNETLAIVRAAGGVLLGTVFTGASPRGGRYYGAYGGSYGDFTGA